MPTIAHGAQNLEYWQRHHLKAHMLNELRTYQIDPRPIALGGGWRLRLLDDDEEMAAVFFLQYPAKVRISTKPIKTHATRARVG